MTTCLTTASPAQLATLRDSSRRVCVTYIGHPLPAGSAPDHARIGIESTSEQVLLHVDRGTRYTGDDPEVSAWLLAGTKRFTDLNRLVAWLSDKLSPTYPSAAAGTAVPPPHLARTSPGDADTGPVVAHDQRPEVATPAAVTDLARVQVAAVTDSRVDPDDLTREIRREVIGQDVAAGTLATAVARHTGKTHPRRPVTIMLLGPTAVGKTLAAQAVARITGELSGGDWEFLRLDMSEFSERFSVSRLLGAPPGYIGYGDGSLASRLASNPRQVVLFDEIDKAHPAVLSTLMNLMDAGRLDAATSGAVTAEQAALIFTSNLSALTLPTAVDAADADRAGRTHLLQHGMTPELVGRFTNVCIFQPLPATALAAVTARGVCTVAADYGLQVTLIDPDYLTDVLSRAQTSTIGVRAIEHLVDAELGPQFAALRSTGHPITISGGAQPQVHTTRTRPEQAGATPENTE